MLSRGEITHEQLRLALDAQRQNGTGRIGEWIQKLGMRKSLRRSERKGRVQCCEACPPSLPNAVFLFSHLFDSK
jgi:hypothetical protein